MHPLRADLRDAIARAQSSVTQTQEQVNALNAFAPYLDDLDIESPLASALNALAQAQKTLETLRADVEAWSTEMENPNDS